MYFVRLPNTPNTLPKYTQVHVFRAASLNTFKYTSNTTQIHKSRAASSDTWKYTPNTSQYAYPANAQRVVANALQIRMKYAQIRTNTLIFRSLDLSPWVYHLPWRPSSRRRSSSSSLESGSRGRARVSAGGGFSVLPPAVFAARLPMLTSWCRTLYIFSIWLIARMWEQMP